MFVDLQIDVGLLFRDLERSFLKREKKPVYDPFSSLNIDLMKFTHYF